MELLDWYFVYRDGLTTEEIALIDKTIQDFMADYEQTDMTLGEVFKVHALATRGIRTVIEDTETLPICRVEGTTISDCDYDRRALVCTAKNGSKYILRMSEQLAVKQAGGMLDSKPYREGHRVNNTIFKWS
ncbi:hypothetical protein IK146_02950 [Candidatus Saccharibacteria bacterium]|nr:hypothetical protein [Candidatus Saccharibacteria bacterium]